MDYANLIKGLALAFLSSNAVGVTATPSEVECLATNVFHEARGESNKGQVAVALVTLNRVRSGKFPSTICGVVYQPNQFSWTRDKPKIKDWKSYNRILALTRNVLAGKVAQDITGGSLYYHADHVNPYWSKHFDKVAHIGNHVFYREG